MNEYPTIKDLRDERALQGWWDGYLGNPARIGLPIFQADYIRGYKEGWGYARY